MDDREHFEARVGSVLRGKWKLERLLGVGGMAAVYEATHKIGRREAIKILHPEVARSKELCQRFEREAHAVNQFKHPGAVEIRDIDTTEEGAPFLVMELLEGESLGERARRMNGIEQDEVLRVTDELLDVLVAAHAQGIVHRDIKLDNLFISNDGSLKVLDFGVARMRESSRELLTRTGATIGTVAYMPPEQVKGMDVDARVDLFAVGATMFRLIARRRVHEARSESEMLVKMATEPAPPLAEVAPHVPAGVAMVVDRALAFERDRRYPDAATMQRDVRAVREGRAPLYAEERLRAGDRPQDKQPSAAGVALAGGAAAGAFAFSPTSATMAAPDATVAASDDATVSAPGGSLAAGAAGVAVTSDAMRSAPLSAASPPSGLAPPSSLGAAPMSLPQASTGVAPAMTAAVAPASFAGPAPVGSAAFPPQASGSQRPAGGVASNPMAVFALGSLLLGAVALGGALWWWSTSDGLAASSEEDRSDEETDEETDETETDEDAEETQESDADPEDVSLGDLLGRRKAPLASGDGGSGADPDGPGGEIVPTPPKSPAPPKSTAPEQPSPPPKSTPPPAPPPAGTDVKPPPPPPPPPPPASPRPDPEKQGGSGKGNGKGGGKGGGNKKKPPKDDDD